MCLKSSPEPDAEFGGKAITKTTRAIPFGILAVVVWLAWGASGQTVIVFQDQNLESAVRWALGKTNGALTSLDMLGLTNLSSWGVVTNFSGLEQAGNLESLTLYNGKPASLLPLTGLTRLSSLSLENSDAVGLADLPRLTTLTNLDLFLSALTNVDAVGSLTNLRYLDLSFTGLLDPSPLAGLPRLKYLDLSGNSWGNCAALGVLTNLSGWLFLDNASITNVEGLAALTNLALVTLYRNPLSDLTPLSRLTSLRSLDLGFDPIGDIAPLAKLRNLEQLYLESASVTNLAPLLALQQLATLDVNNNRLADISALAGLTNLHWVNLSYNHLTNIDALTNLTQLAKVYLQINLIDTNAASAGMKGLTALSNNGVSVEYNPQHQPPRMTLVNPWTVPVNEISSLPISVVDDLIPGNELRLSARSSNTGLVNVAIGQTALSSFPLVSGGVVTMPGRSFVGAPNAPPIDDWRGYLNVSPSPNRTGSTRLSVSATDEIGLSNEITFQVTVILRVPLDGSSLGSSGSNITWSTFGTRPWRSQTNISHFNGSAAQSGTQDSWLQAEVIGPGVLTFYWRYLATNTYGGLAELTAYCPESGLSGQTWMSYDALSQGPDGTIFSDWQEGRISLPSGHWNLRWSVASGSGNPATIWVADASFISGPPVCWLETFPYSFYGGYFEVSLHGPPGETYDIESSADLLRWSRLSRVTMTDFEMLYVEAAGIQPALFYRMHKASVGPIWLEGPGFETNRAVKLIIHSDPQQPLSIEYSTNLSNWVTLVQTNNTLGELHIREPQLLESTARFYRAKALPWGQPGRPVSPIWGINRRHLWPFLPVPPGLPTPGI
ncbi:MAG TPA: leucine-rich repeat domain-containing protein [Candidatus Limnocylindrales bacterium]|nr:leucine-rich repeat domain-containing protein [Candidatus Limnocylindrales bacterium]